MLNFWNQSICWEHVLDPSSIWRDPSCEATSKMPALGVDWSIGLGLQALASHAESDRSNVAAAPVAEPTGGPGADDGKAVCFLFFWMHQSLR